MSFQSLLFITLAAVAAAAAPSLLAYNVAPSPTFLNQALALAAWGWFVVACAAVSPRRSNTTDASALLGALLLLVAAALWSWLMGALPASLGLSAVGLLGAAGLLVVAGVAAGNSPQAAPVFALFCTGWVVAGVLNATLGIVQVFWPDLPDGDWIARSGIPGRAVGNLRQPNHMSGLLLWSCVAVVALVEMKRLARAVGLGLLALMIFAVVLTASRTGLVSVLLLALWAVLDSRLAARTRLMLMATPLLYALAWAVMSAWADAGEHRFGGAARLAETDVSGSRFGIWANTLELVRQQPWGGVGFGEFNFAWSLTPFPGRPVAFFDHAHNLPLHLAAELGLPLAGAVILLLLWALWRAARLAWGSEGDAGVARRCAFLMVLMIGLHSQLEYPLWYAHFLLPAAWAWGFGLAAQGRDRPYAKPPLGAPMLAGFGAALVAGAALSVFDYMRVAAIFSALEDAPPLEQRILLGQRSVFFSHHADYAAATTAGVADHSLKPFAGAAYYLLDSRLMMAWAKALEVNDRHDHARHIAQRLREFHNPQSDEFFAACKTQAVFQCLPQQRVPPWREFTR